MTLRPPYLGRGQRADKTGLSPSCVVIRSIVIRSFSRPTVRPRSQNSSQTWAWHTRIRSAGASFACSPRTPALTYMNGKSWHVAWM